jgi:hypothetical protein
MTTWLAPVLRAASNPLQLARKTMENPRLLSGIIEGLNAEAARVKFGCAKALRILSEQRPDLLYPQFDFFVRLLGHKNKIFQWDGAFVLSQLARLDAEDKFAAVFDKYFAPIPGPVMITAANAIRGGARIARARPEMADRIATEVLKVAKARYQTAECRNVAIGHVVLALGEFLDLIRDPAPATRFVRRQLHNSRPATRKKAERFLKRVQQERCRRTFDQR